MVHKWDRPCWIILYLHLTIESCTRYSSIPSPWIKWEVYLFTSGLGVHDRAGGHQAIATDMLKKNFRYYKLFISILYEYLLNIEYYTYWLSFMPDNYLQEAFIDRKSYHELGIATLRHLYLLVIYFHNIVYSVFSGLYFITILSSETFGYQKLSFSKTFYFTIILEDDCL